ncbi:hypothetical protein EVAR_39969_1 [Eumeta japonica]|uniref:Uncharacterized protein n=1 Tax=Eumeta variegata TaxID=151549 RepID=A0A4C1X4M8_EUMVA|nr:hypothetical protein EVAR_39969_1 [Eumeta japonica]
MVQRKKSETLRFSVSLLASFQGSDENRLGVVRLSRSKSTYAPNGMQLNDVRYNGAIKENISIKRADPARHPRASKGARCHLITYTP